MASPADPRRRKSYFRSPRPERIARAFWAEAVPNISGIELGPDSCVLVRARTRGAVVEVSALHQIEPATWPAHDSALAETLRQLRRAKRFPRRARLVAWGLTAQAQGRDPVARSLLEPFAAAGFRVERVLTPPEALAEIARTRSRGRGVAVAWLAVNVHGAAVAIVRDGELLYGRTVDWQHVGEARGPRAELLQRYSLVAHLAPEVRRGTAQARSTHGAIVEAAVICGDLADLRSLTMPLIEELDLEVETLDSTDGLLASGRALSDRFTASAPAIRLATAAAMIRPPREGRTSRVGPFGRIAAAAAIVAAIGWVGYSYWIDRDSQLANPPMGQTSRSAPLPGRGATPVSPPAPRGTSSRPAPTPVERTVDPATARADIPEPKSVPLKAPLPSVESILVAPDRRLARIDGRIVTVGDQIGPRVVAGIERDAVVLQEPSGHQIRVTIRRGRSVE
jgi:hypothetical protein